MELTVNPQWDEMVRQMETSQLQMLLSQFTGRLYLDPEGNRGESVEAQFIRHELAARILLNIHD